MRETQRTSSRHGGQRLPIELRDLLDRMTPAGRSPAFSRLSADNVGEVSHVACVDLATLGRAVLREANSRAAQTDASGGRLASHQAFTASTFDRASRLPGGGA
jgi:hypothetical protein